MISRKQHYHKQLKDLRNKLAANQMSLLVGSGFSKNVSTKFLTWDELLIDLAYELNERIINSAYERYLSTAAAEPLSEKDFKKEECLHLIRQQGYLEIVSEYVKRKAIPESITTYIEERIPGVYKKDEAFFLDYNGSIEPLPREKLALHKSLINLPWNNIYTTNYDDLLDVCIDNGRYQRLVNEIAQLETEIVEMEQAVRDAEAKKESLSKPTAKPGIEEAGLTPLEGLEPLPVEDPKLKGEIKQLSFDIGQLKRSQQEKELLLSEKSREADDCFQVVKTAAGLRIKKRKNIIKLHGSLRSSRERADFSFGFDGDHKKQYVISKEDYESYPTNHEAFTQLMRISLLQESFCLIGFSGVDPNFLQWINWVRDILYKAARLNDRTSNKQYKIYLMDTGEGEASSDKQLFYENHNIVRIPLSDPDVIELFSEDLGGEVNITDRATAINALITYLGNDDHIKPDIPSPDISVRREHRQIWNTLRIFEPNKIPEEQAIAPMLNRLQAIGQQIWLPDLTFPATHNQHSLLGYVNYQSWHQQLSERPLLRKLVIMALLDMAVPIRSFLETEVIAQLEAQPENRAAIATAISRNDALSVDRGGNPMSRQDEMLHLAYSFQFSALRSYLDNWVAKGRELIVRSGFLAIFDRQAAGDSLSAIVANDTLDSGEEKLYALEMLHHITQPFLTNGSSRISRLIMAYERSGYTGLQGRLEDLQKQVAKKAQDLKPYGDKRVNRTRSVRLSKHSDAEAAVQVLMLLAESGFQITIHNIYLLSSEDWYPVMKAGFEFYPLPFLFYTLQYSKKDFLKKAGQDYTFSNAENVSDQLPLICNALFANLAEAPESYADNIQVFLSSLVIGVDPAIWQRHFSGWWRSLVEKGIAFRKHHLDTHPLLIIACIQYIGNPSIIYEIVGNCLDAVHLGEVDQPIHFLYYLNRNQHFKTMTGSAGLAQPLSEQLDAVITGLDTENISRIFVLGNLFRLLTQEQLEKITAQLEGVDFGKVTNARIWRILLHFANGQGFLGSRMRLALIEHRNLWYTGISGSQISGGLNDEPIPVSFLSYGDLHPNGLKWEDTELKEIFDRLLKALDDIERVTPAPDFFFSFTPVLEEMVEFLIMFQARIGGYHDYQATMSRARRLLNIHRKYKELEEGLTSRDEDAVATALGELDVRVYKDYFQEDDITLLLNKILLQAEPAVESSLGYVTSWLYYKRYLNRFRDQEHLLVRILRKYDAQPLEDSDVAYVEEKLVRIAWLLKTWDNTDPVIARWLERADQSRFNNVRQFLASARTGDKDQDDE